MDGTAARNPGTSVAAGIPTSRARGASPASLGNDRQSCRKAEPSDVELAALPCSLNAFLCKLSTSSCRSVQPSIYPIHDKFKSDKARVATIINTHTSLKHISEQKTSEKRWRSTV